MNQLDQSVDCVLPVSLLRPESPGIDNQDAVSSDSPTGQTNQTLANLVGQRGRVAHVEAELHGRGNLVDILSAWP